MHDVLDDLRASFAGQYDIERELSGGGMSRLFLATERVLGRQVVIKVLPPELTSVVGAARFRRETEVTARLQHPNILPILSAGAHRDVLYYVMPFVAGESLRARMTREGALPLGEALRLLIEVADALACAHDAGVIHRDIKPENVLLQSGHALLADFGVAAALSGDASGSESGHKLTRTGTSPGTVGYMAPEQLASDGDVDARSDVYALGVVAWELLAGRRLFEAENAQALLVAHLVDDPERLDEVRFDVPGHVARTIEKALAKKPDARWQTAAELRDAMQRSLAAVMSAEGGVEKDPLGRRMKVAVRKLRSSMTTQRMTVPKGVPARQPRGRWAVVAFAALAILATTSFLYFRQDRSAGAERVTIAVAPFRVVSTDAVPELDLWSEAIVDVMARHLDDAGTIHAVAPSLVLKRARRPVAQRDAAEFAKGLGARYAIVGTLTPTAGDGVSARMWLVDARTDSVVRDTTWRLTDVRAAVDSMSIAAIDLIGQRHRIGAVRTRSHFAGVKPGALRDFLRGEQFFRRTAWDSALAAYQSAVLADPNFALPIRRIGRVHGWRSGDIDSTFGANALRAGSLNHGLAPRDSLLVVADSIGAVLRRADRQSEPTNWGLTQRFHRTLELAARRYPDDPEVWYTLGEARYHQGYGRFLGATEQATLDAFDRAVALDSSFAPAYVHSVELSYMLHGPEAARRRSEPYLRLDPTDEHAGVIRLLDRLLDPARARTTETERMLDTVPLITLRRGWLAAARGRDTVRVGERLLVTADRRLRRSDSTFAAQYRVLRSFLALEYARQGRFAESLDVNGDRQTRLYVELAMLGAVPRARADSALRSWIGNPARPGPAVGAALAWWARLGAREQIGLVRNDAIRQRDAATRASSKATHMITIARADAFLALVQGDTALALRRLGALPDTSCLECYLDRFEEARLRARLGQFARADSLLGERLFTRATPMELLYALERARVSERLGHLDRARANYERVIAAWGRGDPLAQSYVSEARRGLARVDARTVATPRSAGRG
ncbi:MAG TPA: serine/threonine-protein kinase [Gemmatimonadaceae bacterium]|nr:serine/threonine-protein kinase [Gemmatimonadaceae bacterium]